MEKYGEQHVADINAEGKRLRLIAEVDKTGPIALVRDMKSGQDIIRELVNDLKEGQQKCEECAKGLLSKPPKIVWEHHQP